MNTLTPEQLVLRKSHKRHAGIIQDEEGTFTAITNSESKTFKTIKSAEKWLNRIGFNLTV